MTSRSKYASKAVNAPIVDSVPLLTNSSGARAKQGSQARQWALGLMATDEDTNPEDRLAANEYLLGTTHAVLTARFSSASVKPSSSLLSGTQQTTLGPMRALVTKVDSAVQLHCVGRGDNSHEGAFAESCTEEDMSSRLQSLTTSRRSPSQCTVRVRMPSRWKPWLG